MFAAVPYVLPVVLDVLGLVLVRGVVERVDVHCEGLTAFPQGRRLGCPFAVAAEQRQKEKNAYHIKDVCNLRSYLNIFTKPKLLIPTSLAT